MSCKVCKEHGCDGYSFYHYEDGCHHCRLCDVSYDTIIGRNEKVGPSMKQFDTGPNVIKRFFDKHKTFTKAYIGFSIAFFIFASALMNHAAEVLGNPELRLPSWLPYILIGYSALFGYMVYQMSEATIRRELRKLKG